MSERLHLLMTPALAARRDCMAQFAPGDCLLLLDRGVELLADPQALAELLEHSARRLHVLADDLAARGLSSLTRDRPDLLVDAPGWVRLIVAHRQVLSWT